LSDSLKGLYFFLKNYFSSNKILHTRLKNVLGFYPRNLRLYQLSLKPRSSTVEEMGTLGSGNNERLEFLGDAVLGSSIANFLFKKFPLKDEGFLTKIRSRIVSRQHLNQISLKLGLPSFQEKKKTERFSKSLPGDTLEALIGAIFLDRGFEFTNRWIIQKLIQQNMDIDEIVLVDKDFKSKILEWGYREKKTIKFDIISETKNTGVSLYSVSLTLEDKELSQGMGNSKKAAEQRASEIACGLLNIPDKEE
jgi:ribonuclease III